MRIFITATNTDIGKTYTTLKIMEALANKGYRIGVIKPIETGVENIALDGSKLLEAFYKYNPLSQNFTLNDIVPIQYKLPAAPYIASKNRSLNTELIEKKIQEIEEIADIVLIEGAGGLYVPIDHKTMMIDLIKDLKVDTTLLVTHCELGCINDTILSQKALEEYHLQYETIFNCKERINFNITSYPYIKEEMKNILFLNELDSIIQKIVKKQ